MPLLSEVVARWPQCWLRALARGPRAISENEWVRFTDRHGVDRVGRVTSDDVIQMRPGRAITIALHDPDRMRRLFSSGAKYRHQQEVDGPLVRLLCWEGHLSVRDQRIAEDLQHGHIVDGATRAPRTIWRLQGDLGDTHMSRWCVKNERGLRRDSPYLVPSRPPGRRLARASISRCARPCGAMPPDGDVMNGITRLPLTYRSRRS